MTAQSDADAGNASDAPERIGTIDRTHRGEAAPDHAFLDPAGKPVTLAAFRGKPLLLNLWATWCAPCVREMPTLDRLAARQGDALQVVVLSQDLEGAAKVGPFFDKAKFTALKPYLDPEVRFSTGYGVNLPTTILYDAAGKEVWRVSGDMEWDGETARAWLAEAG
ncbi:TlpA disulfide reductase family protein [Sphingomonas sp.]|uniref:TlpA family protein disulfide reductase n=1 Tax=Sphingomonas sp. TaxID=28214 RepID=UPI0025D5168B|nr:TlpA disulfide reductase family protein [Sphingomonas sp.]